MSYYTETVPRALAEKLKENGMEMETLGEDGNLWIEPTYADVFDWLIEKEIYVNAYPERLPAVTQEYMYAYRPYVNGQIGKESDRTFDWHEAANAAIEKALALI